MGKIMQISTTPFKIVNFYRFMPLGGERSLAEVRDELQAAMVELELKGTILLADEGIHASIAGLPHSVDKFVSVDAELKRGNGIDPSQSESFRRSSSSTK